MTTASTPRGLRAADGGDTGGGAAAVGAIRVVVVDDHPLAHVGLRYILHGFPGLELVGAAHDGDEALALCERLAPDVVLMDVVMPGMDGVEATRRVRARHPQAKVLVLTSFPEGEQVTRALRAGACGYLLKTASAFDLAQAVRAVHAGRSVLAPEAVEALARTAREADAAAPGEDLTAREREVLALVARGLSNAQLAVRLAVTRGTVKFHVANLLAKLGVASRAEAIALAYQRKLVG
jgi:NarL family two-component system response regulator LiaR